MLKFTKRLLLILWNFRPNQTTGWGANNPLIIFRYTGEPEERIVSRFLKEADVFDQSSTLELCKKEESFGSLKLVGNTLCTINAKTNETACQGDSGGPLHYIKDGKAFVVGRCPANGWNKLAETFLIAKYECEYAL